jgi:hypothetical protein
VVGQCHLLFLLLPLLAVSVALVARAQRAIRLVLGRPMTPHTVRTALIVEAHDAALDPRAGRNQAVRGCPDEAAVPNDGR